MAASAAVSSKRAASDQESASRESSPDSGGGKRRRYVLDSADAEQPARAGAEGSFGVVIKARDRRIRGRKVALKRLHGAGQGFDTVRVEHACRGHPSIVEIKNVVADAKSGEVFLVMEFVGNSLRDQIPWSRPEDLVREMMRKLIDAAQKMHSSRVIHRDIKPENILVGAFGALKICDFSSATFMKPAGKPYDECRVGTLPYTSPEQLAGNRCYGPAVDMWALGCIMGELLT
uniref:[RNA-polymerase]-subunit kinase n=1 Tax=Oryza brachyantha TaxID=4533 RepID=J3N118_ORYBR